MIDDSGIERVKKADDDMGTDVVTASHTSEAITLERRHIDSISRSRFSELPLPFSIV